MPFRILRVLHSKAPVGQASSLGGVLCFVTSLWAFTPVVLNKLDCSAQVIPSTTSLPLHQLPHVLRLPFGVRLRLAFTSQAGASTPPQSFYFPSAKTTVSLPRRLIFPPEIVVAMDDVRTEKSGSSLSPDKEKPTSDNPNDAPEAKARPERIASFQDYMVR